MITGAKPFFFRHGFLLPVVSQSYNLCVRVPFFIAPVWQDESRAPKVMVSQPAMENGIFAF